MDLNSKQLLEKQLYDLADSFLEALVKYGMGRLEMTDKQKFGKKEKVDRAYFLLQYTFEKLKKQERLSYRHMKVVEKYMLQILMRHLSRPIRDKTSRVENYDIMNNVIANFLYMNENIHLGKKELKRLNKKELEIYEKIKNHSNQYNKYLLERKLRNYDLSETALAEEIAKLGGFSFNRSPRKSRRVSSKRSKKSVRKSKRKSRRVSSKRAKKSVRKSKRKSRTRSRRAKKSVRKSKRKSR